MRKMYTLDHLLYLMARLRDPIDGCAWDRKQTLTSINHSTIEEAYELVDALQQSMKESGKANDHVQEELGDVLFQVVFYSQLAKEDNSFQFSDVVNGLVEKLIRRHPHVFPGESLTARASDLNKSEEAIKTSWETIKQTERKDKSQQGVFDDIPRALPALIRAQKIQKRASNIGFDWPNAQAALHKVEEETVELRHALIHESPERAEEELADLLFSCVNVSRLMKSDAESTLEKANLKFQRRFQYIEKKLLNNNSSLEEASLAVMDELWEEAKRSE